MTPTATTREALEPCPFCGAQPTDHAIEPHSHALKLGEWKMPDHTGSHVIECGCGAGLIADTFEEVAAMWNRRPSQQAAAGETEGAEAVAKPLFDTLIEGYFAHCKIEEAIGEILGVDILGVSHDYYDSSLEIFPEESVADVVVSREQSDAILALGCNRFWINFPDSTERYGCGPRTAKGYCRWNQFNRNEALQRRQDRTHPTPVSAEEAQDAARLDWIARQDLDDIVFGLVVDAPHDGEYVVNAGRGPFYGKTFREALDAARGEERKAS